MQLTLSPLDMALWGLLPSQAMLASLVVDKALGTSLGPFPQHHPIHLNLGLPQSMASPCALMYHLHPNPGILRVCLIMTPKGSLTPLGVQLEV